MKTGLMNQSNIVATSSDYNVSQVPLNVKLAVTSEFPMPGINKVLLFYFILT